MTKSQIQSEIDQIKDQLIKKYNPQKIILFGSVAQYKETSNSDIDFLIIKDEKKNFHDRVVGIYKLINKNIAADFFVYTPQELEEKIQQGDPFIKSVLSTGKILYG